MGAEGLAPALAAAKWAFYVAALLAAGVSLHVALGIVSPSKAWARIVIVAALAAIALQILRLGLLNAQLGAGPFNADMFAMVWRFNGAAASALALGALLTAAGVAIGQRALAALGAIAIAASFALTGHTQTLEQPLWEPLAVATHATIAAFWLAAPATLWPVSAMQSGEIVRRLERFSAIALFAVPVLFALGLALTWRLAGSVAAVLDTGYGRLMLLKLSAATLALGLGAANKLYVASAVRAEKSSGRSLLRRALVADGVLFAVALGAVAIATTIVGPES